MFKIISIIIVLFSLIYNFLSIFDKTNIEKSIEHNKNKIKKWEEMITFITITLLLSIILFLYFKYPQISFVYAFIVYLTIILLYISILINILLKKTNKKISYKELNYITAIPGIVCILYNSGFYKNIFNKLNKIFEKNLVYIIIIKNLKYFLSIFFLSLLLVLTCLKIKKYIHIKKVFELRYEGFNEENYIYMNARGKKGFKFVIYLIKDILILIKSKLLSIVQGIYINSFIFVYRIIKKYIKRITNNFSIQVIITKTFSISLIISMLITYYKLLIIYGSDNIILNFYSLIITTIIIPIILNIMVDLKEKNE